MAAFPITKPRASGHTRSLSIGLLICIFAIVAILALSALPALADEKAGTAPQSSEDAVQVSGAASSCIDGLLDCLAGDSGGDVAAALASDALDPADSVGAWIAFDLIRAGLVDEAAKEAYAARIEEYVTGAYASEAGGLDRASPTVWARTAIVANAYGLDPTAVGTDASGRPANLLADGIYDWSYTDSLGDQGSNAWIYALIALDACEAQVPAGARYQAADIVDGLMACQAPDGSFSIRAGGASGSVDLTAMAVAALASHAGDARVDAALEGALAYLSGMQLEDGRFEAEGSATSESSAMVAIGLAALGIDPASDEAFSKAGGTVLSGLLSFQKGDGTFVHADADDRSRFQALPTEQALRALLACTELQQGGDGNIYTADAALSIGAAAGPAEAAGGGGGGPYIEGPSLFSMAVGAVAALVVIGVLALVGTVRKRRRLASAGALTAIEEMRQKGLIR